MFFSRFPPLPTEYSYLGQTILLKPYRRARNLKLAYDAKQKQFRISAPVYVTSKEIQNFLKRAEPWLQEKLDQHKDQIYLNHDVSVPIFGQACRIYFQKDLKRKVEFNSEVISVCHPQDKHKELLESGMKEYAHQFFTKTSLLYAEMLGVKIGRITIRDTYSRWGSCAPNGNLSYSWRLIFAPLEVAEYVCAHEVSHRIYMNHSKDFWKTVTSLCPQYKTHRAWLKENGKEVFKYKF